MRAAKLQSSGPRSVCTTSSAAAPTSFRKMPSEQIGRAHEISDELAVGALIYFVRVYRAEEFVRRSSPRSDPSKIPSI